jgi:hypothetical protein
MYLSGHLVIRESLPRGGCQSVRGYHRLHSTLHMLAVCGVHIYLQLACSYPPALVVSTYPLIARSCAVSQNGVSTPHGRIIIPRPGSGAPSCGFNSSS